MRRSFGGVGSCRRPRSCSDVHGSSHSVASIPLCHARKTMTCTSSSRRWAVVDHYTEVAEYRQYPGTLSRRSERMLEQTIRVLAPHRPRVHSSASHHAAWRARDNVVWYFDRLLDEILGDVRNR